MKVCVFVRILIIILFLQICQGESWTASLDDGIQARIDQASPGDIILIDNGTYYENVIINKSIILRGKDWPIIDGNGTGSAITILGNGTEIEGLAIRNSKDSPFQGIRIQSNDNVIMNNIIFDCNLGLDIQNAYNNTIRANDINNNSIGLNFSQSSFCQAGHNIIIDNDMGISLWRSDNNSLGMNNFSSNQQGLVIIQSHYNNLSNNTASFNSENGISMKDSNNNDINHSRVNYNKKNGLVLQRSNFNKIVSNNLGYNAQNGLSLEGSCNNSIKNNDASNSTNSYGINVKSKSNDNVLNDNFISDSYQQGLIISQSFNNTIKNNSISNNKNGGIRLFRSEYCLISENRLHKNTAYGIQLDESGNSNITNNSASNNPIGITLTNSNSCMIAGNYLGNCSEEGIHIESGFSNRMVDNFVRDSQVGILLKDSNENLLENNRAMMNVVGIILERSQHNVVEENIFSNNGIGAFLNRSNDSIFSRDIASDNNIGFAFNLSYNYTFENISMLDNKHDIITNENESISKYTLWKDIVLPEFSQGPQYNVSWKKIGTESVQLVRVSSSLRFQPTISSHPGGAKIWLDGKPTGKTTPDSVKIKGRTYHEIKLVLDGYETKIERIKITTSTPIEFDLNPIKSPEGEVIQAGSNESKKEVSNNTNNNSNNAAEHPDAHDGRESAKPSPADGFSELFILLLLAKRMINKG